VSRIRTVKPEWLQDERLALASAEARVLSIALILLADDYGNGRANSVVLGATVFPGEDSPRTTFVAAAEELIKIRFVRFYEVDGQRYFSIRNWSKHQRVDHPSDPKVPAPRPEDDDTETAHLHTADGPGAGAQNRAGTADGPEQRDHAATTAVSKRKDTKQVDSRNSRESLENDSGGFRSSRDPIPSSDLSLLTKPLTDLPEKPGSAHARSKPQAKAKPTEDRVPRPLAQDWQPEAEQVSALAAKHQVTEARIRAMLPEFVWYWRKDGKKTTARGWAQTFSNRMDTLAKNGQLYIARPGESAPTTPDDADERRKRAAEVEARARAVRDAKPRVAGSQGAS